MICLVFFQGRHLKLNHHDNTVTNFHLSMLTDEKENEMLIQRNSGRKCPDFKNDTKLSENVNNYALSICFRKTWFKKSVNFYAIIDPDSTAVTTALDLPVEEMYLGALKISEDSGEDSGEEDKVKKEMKFLL